MQEILNDITTYGAGVFALAFVFVLAWYSIQRIVPVLMQMKSASEVTLEVIKNNTQVTQAVIEALTRVESHLSDAKRDHETQQKNYEIHNERTIRVEQNLGILLDRSLDK